MNQNNLTRLLSDCAETQEWTHQTRLWPRIMARLPQRRTKDPALRVNRALSAAALALIAMIVFVAVTPSGQALAQQVLGFFIKTSQPESIMPAQTLVPVVDPAQLKPEPIVVSKPSDCGTFLEPRCSIAEVETYTGLQLLSFDPLPQDLEFTGATYKEGTAYLVYRSLGGSLILQESARQDLHLKPWLVGENASIQQVLIGQTSGEYVQGAWWPSEDGQLWEGEANQHSLRWETENLRISLIAAGGKVYEPLKISRDELILLAASLTQVDSRLQLPDDQTDLDQLSAEAGFEIHLPQELIPGFYLAKTKYEPATGAVCSYYHWGASDDKAFVIGQMPGNLPASLFQNPQTVIDGQTLSRELFRADWEIPGAADNRGMYLDYVDNVAALCPEPGYYVNHGLTWSKDGISYGIFGLGSYFESYADFFLSKADMQSYAAQINAVPVPNEGFDPERFYNPKDAETILGEPLALPKQMLSDFNFAYIGMEGNSTVEGERPLALRTVFLGPVTAYGSTSSLQIEYISPSNLSMEEIEAWGAFDRVQVWGKDALIRSFCSAMPALEGVNFCRSDLYWLQDNHLNSIRIIGNQAYDHSLILQVAESMRK